MEPFANRKYYGTVSHNVKAQYQSYFGWFDGNPASLHSLPPVDLARRTVDAMGGADAVLAAGRDAHRRGDDRRAATLLNHIVFAAPTRADAREALADVYEQLGYRSESGPVEELLLDRSVRASPGRDRAAEQPDTEKHVPPSGSAR